MKQKIAEVQFYSWDKTYFYDPGDLVLKIDDWVVAENEFATDLGRVVSLGEVNKEELLEAMPSILRIASLEDLQNFKEQQKKKKEALVIAKELIKKYSLPMKLVEANFTYDDTRIIFAFTSETRVDFRELAKELTRVFHRGIRLQQIGIRDELKHCGGIGPCGRELCCFRFLKDLGNITGELARIQQIEHRGSERLSGACGRLKCCLAYEVDSYKEILAKFPPLESQIKTSSGQMGKVVGINILRHSVQVELEKDNVVEEFLGCSRVSCSGCWARKFKSLRV